MSWYYHSPTAMDKYVSTSPRKTQCVSFTDYKSYSTIGGVPKTIRFEGIGKPGHIYTVAHGDSGKQKNISG